ncbi:hypothetical protein QJS10_CPA16g00187 [Acorus calamus]|uniref:C2 NT-type domain-containing protein n=1 Tax=Acorus calamus TaxID=4465 RepID=A0AAV9D3K0_ACOCL|nr:hypothetical protein QJS10_CPA16g00187 [Acorus calamus]
MGEWRKKHWFVEPGIPILGLGNGDGKIEFNESFKMKSTLLKEGSTRNGESSMFRKNTLEFNLYELRKDGTAKGHLLCTAIIDLSEHGIVKEAIDLNVRMDCKRVFSKTNLPVLSVKICPFDKESNGSSSLLKETSLNKDTRESVSALMNEEYAEEAEVSSFTDDDMSSHSSLTTLSSAREASSGSPFQSGLSAQSHQENDPESVKESKRSDNVTIDLPLPTTRPRSEVNSLDSAYAGGLQNEISPRSSSVDLFYDPESTENDNVSASNSSQCGSGRIDAHVIQPSSSLMACEVADDEVGSKNGIQSTNRDELFERREEKNVDCRDITKSIDGDSLKEDNSLGSVCSVESSCKANGIDEENHVDREANNVLDGEIKKDENHSVDTPTIDPSGPSPAEDLTISPITSQNEVTQNPLRLSVTSDNFRLSRRVLVAKGSNPSYNDGPKEAYSVYGNNRRVNEENGNTIKPERVSRESLNASLGGKVRQLQHRVKMLEGELRDAAAAEVSLYSIVAEHGSSAQKVHTPARRLSRIYIHAFKQSSPERRASAARSAVSGLVLAAKACGNDVPRLTFWLSNSVVLRVIITEVIGTQDHPILSGPNAESNGNRIGTERKSPTLKWNESTVKERVFSSIEDFDDWEDPKTFTAALEKIEDWIFSRVIESVWWQALAPHMQLAYRGSSSTKSHARKARLSDHQQANLSIDLWKEAFKDACERLCPVRAGGHECGCLPVLARLVMEQCVARLDVAMFNAILRESDDDVPTDPVSDPITDSKVLPVPSGRSSFGAGAQLKNAIGNWSRWLSDLFGLDDAEDEDFPEDDVKSSLKTFHLLNALSDLLMLPKDLLLDKSIRKEVCPTFGAPVIRRVLSSFVPDEFCPDPVPEAVLEALDSEESLETSEEPIRSFPCSAAPLVYTPPSPASVTGFTGDLRSQHQLRRSRSSILRRCQTSDDELDELGSPLASIVIENGRVSPTVISTNENTMNSRNVLRYQLLRGVWQDGDF